MDVHTEIMKLTRQLYPTGRAWKMPIFGDLEKFHRACAEMETQAYEDAVSFLKSLLPDNSVFSSDDATDWERRLGIVTNLSTPLADRKAAIIRKLQAPGRNPAKAHYLYIQQQLQLAGFDVYVHENMNPLYPSGYTEYNPITLNSNIFSNFYHGDAQHGVYQHGGFINHVVANSIDNDLDIGFDTGENLRCTFFIGGQTLGTYATVPASREIEFRQLILQLKPVQNIAFLYITYT